MIGRLFHENSMKCLMASGRRLPASFYHVLVFLFLFIPYVRVGSFVLHLPYFYLLSFAAIFLAVFCTRGVSREYLHVSMFIVASYSWVLWVSLWNGKFDMDMQVNYLNAFLVMFGAFGLSLILAQRFNAGSALFLVKSIYYAGVAHAIIMIVAFFLPLAREVIYSFVVLGDTGQEFIENLYRAPGLTTGGGDSLSVIQSTALVFGIYHLVTLRNRVSSLALLLHLAFFILLVISVLLSARTGVVIFVLGLGLLGSMHFGLMLRDGKFSRATLVKLGLLLGIFSLSLPALYVWVMNSEYSRLAMRAFELYINFAEYGQLGTSSTEQLKNMYFLPDSEKHFLFGDGNFGRDTSLGIIPSDVGYVRVWFGGGIVGLVVFYMPIVLMAVYFAKRAAITKLFFPLIFISSLLLLVNVKVYHLYGAHVGLKVLLLIVGILIGMRWVSPAPIPRQT